MSGKTKDDFGIGEARFVTFLNVLTNAIIDTSILEAVNVFEGDHQNEVRKGDLLFNTSSETPEEVQAAANAAAPKFKKLVTESIISFGRM